MLFFKTKCYTAHGGNHLSIGINPQSVMKCPNCNERKMKTIYPRDGKTQFVGKWCLVCNWKGCWVEVLSE
jgi:hypothetical protein